MLTPDLMDGPRRRITNKGVRALRNDMLALRRRDWRAHAKWSRVGFRWQARYIQATYQRIGIRYPMHGMVAHNGATDGR